MPRCPQCHYVYGQFVDTWQSCCPKCHLRTIGGHNSDLKAHIQARWAQILRDKDVNQGPWGICGMAASLHVLLCHKPDRASTLAAATFYDFWKDVIPGYTNQKEFPTANRGKQHIDLPYIIRRHAQMWHEPVTPVAPLVGVARAVAAAAHAPVAVAPAAAPAPAAVPAPVAQLRDLYFTDFCVSRALGYLLRQTAPMMYDYEKEKFSKKWETPSDSRQKMTRGGSLALETDTVAYILRDLLGAKVKIVHRIKNESGVTTDAKRTFFLPGVERLKIDKIAGDRAAGTKGGMIDGIAEHVRSGFVIAAIDHTLIDSSSPMTAGLNYDHWVVIKSANRIGANSNRLNIWSWGEAKDFDRNDADLMSKIYDLVVGTF